MRIELWAVDATGGRAIVRQGGHWFLVSKEQNWHPVYFGGQARAFACFLSPSMAWVRQPHGTLAEAILEARRACAAGNAPPGLVRRFLGRTRPSGGSAPDPSEERFSSIVYRCSGFLDGFFEGRGCSADESFELSLKTFRRLLDEGPPDTEEALLARLQHLALDICPIGRQTPRARSRESWSAEPLNELEAARITKALLSLDARTLRCLYFWAVEGKTHEEVARLMRLSVDDVRARLFHAADRVGRSVDLRSAELVAACNRAIKGPRH